MRIRTTGIVHWVIRKHKSSNLWRIIGIVISFILSNILVSHFSSITFPFQLETSIMMFGYVEIGVLTKEVISNNIRFIREKRILTGLIIGFMLIIGIVLCRYNGFTDVATYIFGRSVSFYLLESIILSMVVIATAVVIGNSSILTYLGTHTLPILLMHKFPILFFQVVIPFSKNALLITGGGTVTL